MSVTHYSIIVVNRQSLALSQRLGKPFKPLKIYLLSCYMDRNFICVYVHLMSAVFSEVRRGIRNLETGVTDG